MCPCSPRCFFTGIMSAVWPFHGTSAVSSRDASWCAHALEQSWNSTFSSSSPHDWSGCTGSGLSGMNSPLSPRLRRIPPDWHGLVNDFMEVEWSHYFWQSPYGYPALYGYAPSNAARPLPSKQWKECPTCGYRWQDVHGKDECPKCLNRLSDKAALRIAGGWRREPGETSTFKLRPNSAMESEYGTCSYGGLHSWRFGRCRKCGLAEGEELSNYYAAQRRGYFAHPAWAEMDLTSASNYRTASKPAPMPWPSAKLATDQKATPEHAADSEEASSEFAQTLMPAAAGISADGTPTLSGSPAHSGDASTARLAPSPDTTWAGGTPASGHQVDSPTAFRPPTAAWTAPAMYRQQKQPHFSRRAQPSEASLATKLHRISEFLGLETGLPALLAVQQANELMGIAPVGTLPAQVDTLLAACLGNSGGP